MPLFGIDISHWQGHVDMNQVRRQGFDFAIVKASDGVGYGWGDYFTDHVRRARAAGLIPGAYHWLTRADSAAAQLRDFRARVEGAGGPDGMLLAVDVEADPNRADVRFGDVRDFVRGFRAWLPRHPLLIYSGHWYWHGHMGNPDASGLDAYLWNSRYPNYDGGTAQQIYNRYEDWLADNGWRPGYGGWVRTTILQFTSSATVAGKAPVDANAFDGTRQQLAALAGGSGEDDVSKQDVLDAMRSDEGQRLIGRSVLRELRFDNPTRRAPKDNPGADDINVVEALQWLMSAAFGQDNVPVPASSGIKSNEHFQGEFALSHTWDGVEKTLTIVRQLAKNAGVDIDEAALAENVVKGVLAGLADRPAEIARLVSDSLPADLAQSTADQLMIELAEALRARTS